MGQASLSLATGLDKKKKKIKKKKNTINIKYNKKL